MPSCVLSTIEFALIRLPIELLLSTDTPRELPEMKLQAPLHAPPAVVTVVPPRTLLAALMMRTPEPRFPIGALPAELVPM